MFSENSPARNMMNGHYFKLTENGASASAGSGAGALLDLFSVCGSLRTRPYAAGPMLEEAIGEDPLNAMKLAFYTRDIRGGLGERRTARVMFRTMAVKYPELLKKNLELIPEFGRWDDLLCLLGSPLEEDVISLIQKQLEQDILSVSQGKPVSLLAKWLPSVNASSGKTKRQGRHIAERLGMSEREYRKTLSALRSYLNVTEVRMSEKEFERIDYSAVPSVAMNRLHRAFMRNDEERFSAYLDQVKEGKETIHSEALFPYDITMKYWENEICSGMHFSGCADEVLEAQWKALPDYVEKDANYLVMVDISGSMYGLPIATSIGLGIYFAERNRGPFADMVMLFAERPELIALRGDTVYDKMRTILSQRIGYSTDLEAAFELVLRTAGMTGASREELPEKIIVISDNEINSLRTQTEWHFADEMKKRYAEEGYEMPGLVLWNVDSRQNTFLASGEAENVQFCSGQAVSVFKNLIKGLQMNPYEYMMLVLQNPRYDCVKV